MDESGQGVAERETSAQSRRERDEQTRLRSLGALSHMLPVLSIIYAAAAVLFLVSPPFVPAGPHVLICAASSALVLVVWAGMRADDPRFDTPISMATISIAAGMGLVMFAVSGSISNTTTLAIAVVAAGALLYRFSMYAVMVGVVLLGWIPLAWGSSSGAFSLGLFHLWAATIVGALVLWSRRGLMLTLHEEAEEADAMRRLATDQSRSLERARDAALASARAKEQFLANVSHEVRTPLNGILGLLQLIDASALPAPQDDYLTEVDKSARSLLAIVNDLLDLSKIEAGQMRLESVPFDIVATTEEIAVNYASAAQARGIELLTEIDPDVPTEVFGDPLRLRQVLSNLVNNALKFTKEGEIVIQIRVRGRGTSSVDLEIRVSDTGVGISAERVESIFRPFTQADTSTTREYGGTGLGLPICRQLVELMGGQLQVESAPGRGSTFFFEARFELEEKLSHELRAGTEALAGMRVLVLESNERARETLVARLEAWGMEVSSAANFDTVMRQLRGQAHPEVSLIDLRSLGKDWRGRAAALNRATVARAGTVVAICTHRHEISELGRAGIDVHVEKPIRRAKIIAALLDAANRRATRRPIAAGASRNTSAPAPPPTQLVSNGMKVLVAEDNAVNQKVALAHLRALGYEVDLVEDGLAALAALQGEHPYGAVIMDGQMPRMDGYEATRLQREREAASGERRVPIIALTAHAMTGDRSAAFAAGMDDYLSKPFTRKQLHRALMRWAARPPIVLSDVALDELDAVITSQLLELDEDEPGFLCEVIDSFLSTAERSISRMRAAIEREDLDDLRAAAHMVRGSSQQLGVRRFAATCLELEKVSHARDGEPILAKLERDLEGARDALTGLADRALDAAS